MELNKNYRIVYDSDNTILQFFEQREKTVKDEATKKYVGTGEYKEFTENFYYPNLKTALIGFLNKCTWGQENAKEVLSILNKLELLINKIK
ncbi:MAG: hypothetical protein H7239_10285 [Flavobacterium sp.]|nr:hypothetical protein [Flavobacterium sp.]